jgi:hypothetical protein
MLGGGVAKIVLSTLLKSFGNAPNVRFADYPQKQIVTRLSSVVLYAFKIACGDTEPFSRLRLDFLY